MATLIDSYGEANYSTIINISASGTFSGVGQSFTNTDSITLDSAKFYIRRVNSQASNITVSVYEHSGTFGTDSIPTGSALATSDPIVQNTLSTSLSLVTFNFTGVNRITLSPSTNYVVTIEYTGGVSLSVGIDASSPTHGGNYSNRKNSDSVWVPVNSVDTIFYVYGEVASGPANLKIINGLEKALIKSINGLAIGSIKSINGLT